MSHTAPVCDRCGDLDREGNALIPCESSIDDGDGHGVCGRCHKAHIANCIECFVHHVGRSKKDARNADQIHADMYRGIIP